jgi:predicted acyl esterase
VQLQVRTLTGFVPRAEWEWPLARTRWTRLYLAPATGELRKPPPRQDASVSYQASSQGVTFIAPPLERETEITGPVAARLFVASSVADADLFCVLRVLDPDGSDVTFPGAIDPHTPVAQGWLRVSHRKLDPALSTGYRPCHAHDELQPLVPGKVYQADVEIWPTSVVAPAGYRIGLTVRGRDWERRYPGAPRLGSFKNEMTGCGPFLHDDPVDRPPELAGSIQTLFTGPRRPAYLLLPVIPGTADTREGQHR